MPRRADTSGYKDPHWLVIGGKRVTAAELNRQVTEGHRYFFSAQLRRPIKSNPTTQSRQHADALPEPVRPKRVVRNKLDRSPSEKEGLRVQSKTSGAKTARKAGAAKGTGKARSSKDRGAEVKRRGK